MPDYMTPYGQSFEDSLPNLPKKVKRSVKAGDDSRIGMIRNIVPVDGLPGMAIVDFPGEPGVVCKLKEGKGSAAYPGQNVRVLRTGGVIDPTHQIIEVMTGVRTLFGEGQAGNMAKPVLSGASTGGVYTESNTATATNPNAVADAGAPIKAKLVLYPRSIVLGSYSAYQQRAKAIRIQCRELVDTEWPEHIDFPMMPNEVLRGKTVGALTTGTTSFNVTIEGDRANQMLVGQPAFWQIGAESILAIATNNGGGSFTLMVTSHDSNPDHDPSLGQGFTMNDGGRGMGDTDAESHDAGSIITLHSCMVAVGNLRPNTDYQVRIAFVNANGQNGSWSDVLGFKTWKQPVKPAAPVFVGDGVEQQVSVLRATWNPVITDANGEYTTAVTGYHIVRAAAALSLLIGAALNLNDPTQFATFKADIASAGGTYIGYTPATAYDVPASVGAGNFIGIAAVNSDGLLGNWTYDSDTLAPPVPDWADVLMYDIQDGIAFQVPDTSTSWNAQTGAAVATPAHADRGWVEYLLWQAGGPSGSSPVLVGRVRASSGVVALPGGVTGWYKLTSGDAAGNIGSSAAPNNANWATGWKFVISRYAETGTPPNGNFQIPNNTDTDAYGWARTLGASNGGIAPTAFYENTGGLEGNRVYRLRGNWGVPSLSPTYYPVVLTGYASRIIPAHVSSSGAIWIKHDYPVPNVDFVVSIDYVVYATDYAGGSGLPVTGAGGSVVNVPTGVWTRVPLSGTDPRATSITARRAEYKIYVSAVSTFGGLYPVTTIGVFNVWVDAARIIFAT